MNERLSADKDRGPLAASIDRTDANARYERLVELAPDGILIHDGERIVSANAAAVRMAGATRREQLVGMPVESVLRPPFLKGVGRQLTGAVDEAVVAPVVRDTLHRLDGRNLEVEVRAQLFIEHGRPAAHLVIRDITDRLAAEDLARNLAAHLQATQKLEAVGALAGGVAHEVNNMLQVVLGFGALLLENQSVGPDALNDVREILKAASHAAVVTRQLLEFSRHAVHRPQVMDLSAAVRNSAPVLRRLLGETRHLQLTTHGTPQVWIDPGQLEQILVNLAINARDATVDGDEIAVAVATQEIRRPIAAANDTEIPVGRYATLRMRDTGHGMDADTCSRIFEPFYTTKGVGKGTGLGLSAVQGILGQHSGFITVTSALGSGTTFTLYFPLDAEELHETPSQSQSAIATLPVTDGARILVVDDEPSVRTVTARMLERAGYVVERASDGREALDVIARLGPPALVITDQRMPGMGGHELAAELRRRWPMLPVLMMTGYAFDPIEAASGEVAFGELIEKPFTPAVMLARVAQLLADAED